MSPGWGWGRDAEAQSPRAEAGEGGALKPEAQSLPPEPLSAQEGELGIHRLPAELKVPPPPSTSSAPHVCRCAPWSPLEAVQYMGPPTFVSAQEAAVAAEKFPGGRMRPWWPRLRNAGLGDLPYVFKWDHSPSVIDSIGKKLLC